MASPIGEAGLTIQQWFEAGQRVSCKFFVNLLDCGGRTEHVSCHLIEDLVKDYQPEEGCDAGDIPCVTFLHGYPTCSYAYYPIVQRLLAGKQLKARLLLIDMLGYGDSDKGIGEARFSIQQHANVVQAVWQRYDIKQSHLVVHDFAVSVAQELLSRQPRGRLSTQLQKVFWLNGSVFIDLYRPPALQQVLASPSGWVAARLLSSASWATSLKAMFSKDHPPTKQVLDDIYQGMANREGEKIHHKLVRFMKDRRRYKFVWQGALELSMRQDARRHMFFWGMQDPMSGSHVAAELHARYAAYGIRISEHADLGHCPHLEDPDRVAAALVDFLTEEYVPSHAQPVYNEMDGSIYQVSVCNGQLRTNGFMPAWRRKSTDVQARLGEDPLGGRRPGTPDLITIAEVTAVEPVKATAE